MVRVPLALALCLVASVVRAEATSVVVLEIEGDGSGELRDDIESAVRDDGRMVAVPLRKYLASAMGYRYRGSRAYTQPAIAAVARELRLHAVVGGEVTAAGFQVRIHEPTGKVAWSRTIPLVGGRLARVHGEKLANAIYASTQLSSSAQTGRAGKQSRRADASAPPSGPPAEPNEPMLETSWLRLQILGATLWRSFCARPGVTTCREYDEADPTQREPGVPVTYSSRTPYVAFTAAAEVFPIRAVDATWVRGLGVFGRYARGTSRVSFTGPTGEARDVTAIDQAYAGAVTYRQAVQLGSSPSLTYVAGRVGVGGQSFLINAREARILGAWRFFPLLGASLTLPVVGTFALEVAASYFFNPRYLGPEAQQLGTSFGSGFEGELGLSGRISGPIGYLARGKYTLFRDRFQGNGRGWPSGGIAQETYVSALVGLYLEL